MIYKNVEIYNYYEIAFDEEEKVEKLCRIPNELRKKLCTIGRKYSAFNATGCEIRFNLNSETAAIKIKVMNEQAISGRNGIAEVYFGCFQSNSYQLLGSTNTEISVKKPENLELLRTITKEYNLPFDAELVRIILPKDCQLMILTVEGEVSPPRKEQVPGIKWLTYGSSITHGSEAISPSGTYVNRTAQKLGVDVINMGFGGSAELEAPMADHIASRRDWDFATFEMGINMIWDIENNKIGDPALFKARIDYFLPKIAKTHPDKWIFCIDIFTTSGDYSGDQHVNKYREIVKQKVEELNIPKLKYVCGRDILTINTGLTVDLIHPSAQGMENISENLARLIKTNIKEISFPGEF